MKKLEFPDNLTTLAYQQIRAYILEGKLEGGVRLTEESVAKRLGTSKSPVREAFNRLEAEGLLKIEPRRGACIPVFSSEDISDVYDFREAIEAHAVLTANITPKLIGELIKSVERLRYFRKRNEKDSYIEEDINFHAVITSATANARLQRELDKLQQQLRLFRRKTYDLSSSTAVEIHTQLANALQHEDRDQATALMRAHIRGTRDHLLRFVSESRDVQPGAIGPALLETTV